MHCLVSLRNRVRSSVLHATSVRSGSSVRISMKTLLVGAVGVLAIEVLLVWGYFGMVEAGVGS